LTELIKLAKRYKYLYLLVQSKVSSKWVDKPTQYMYSTQKYEVNINA